MQDNSLYIIQTQITNKQLGKIGAGDLFQHSRFFRSASPLSNYSRLFGGAMAAGGGSRYVISYRSLDAEIRFGARAIAEAAVG